MSVLVDTSSWVHALRKDGEAKVRARVHALLHSAEAAWCDMVRLELWNGVSGDYERKILRAFENDLPLLAIDRETWAIAVDLSQKARTAGITVPSTDLLIYACSLRHEARLEHCDSHYDLLARVM